METWGDQNWTWRKLLGFLMPAILSMVMISCFVLVDGIFTARYAGGDALAGLNITLPLFTILSGIILMVSVGGGTLIAIRMGRGEAEQANELFTQLVVGVFLFTAVITAAAALFLDPLVRLLGASDRLAPYAKDYLKYQLYFSVLFFPKMAFEYLLRTDGSSAKALQVTVIGGAANIVLDYVFMDWFGLGIIGAALGTGIGGSIGCLLSLKYFLGSRSTLKFKKFRWNFRFWGQSCINGSSEMVNEWSMGIVTFLFNHYALEYYGEAGVAAVSAVSLIGFLLVSAILGAGMGFSPLVSYYLGSADHFRRKIVARKSFLLMFGFSMVAFLVCFFGGGMLASVFASPGADYREILVEAFGLFGLAFVFQGMNIFASNYYTALNNGKISAAIAGLRSFFGVVAGILLLPRLLGAKGLWLAIPFAEVLTVLLVLGLWLGHRTRGRRTAGQTDSIQT